MGWFSYNEGPYKDIPDERLDWNQQQQKKWQSNAPFPVDSGGTYPKENKVGIDSALQNSLGLTDIDDLFQMKAPRFYAVFNELADNAYNTWKIVNKNLVNHDKYKELQGKYEELQKRCEYQEALIEKLMNQKTSTQANQIESNNHPLIR